MHDPLLRFTILRAGPNEMMINYYPWAVYCEDSPSFICGEGRSQKWGTTIPVYNWHTHSKHIPVNSWHTLSKHATAAFISAALLSAVTKLRRLALCAFILKARIVIEVRFSNFELIGPTKKYIIIILSSRL